MHATDTKLCFLNQDNYFSSKILRIRILFDAFQVAILKKATLKEGIGYITEAYNIACAVFSPNSSCAKDFKMYLDKPSNHHYYLARESQHF